MLSGWQRKIAAESGLQGADVGTPQRQWAAPLWGSRSVRGQQLFPSQLSTAPLPISQGRPTVPQPRDSPRQEQVRKQQNHSVEEKQMETKWRGPREKRKKERRREPRDKRYV